MKRSGTTRMNALRRMRGRCLAACLLACLFAGGSAGAATEEPDLLTRATELAAQVEPAVWRYSGGMMLSRQWAGQPGRSIAAALSLGEGEMAHLLDKGGGLFFSSDPYLTTRTGYRYPSGGQLARRELFKRAMEEARGVGSYRSIGLSGTEIVRREMAWVEMEALGRAWVLIYERERPVAARDANAPLIGKWLGAYSMEGFMVLAEGGEVEDWQEGGRVSALILQNGAQCLVRLFSDRWEMQGAGLVVSNHLRIGEARMVPYTDDEVWMFDADYEAESDRIRGVVRVVGPRVVTERAIFLHRFEPE